MEIITETDSQYKRDVRASHLQGRASSFRTPDIPTTHSPKSVRRRLDDIFVVCRKPEWHSSRQKELLGKQNRPSNIKDEKERPVDYLT